ncbi:hypothetical protein ABAC460_17110 [Asticcacaulis sp. AC460]|uniref:tyrosine-type recombinase/integrase n=1 Tax=Asticcacaulis sp. AC460 TaxID=1282360 RepID=UPI0003C3D97F|nr:site-specific integrase [Asticcacaulis sp. AC460]ESQ87910.1 hypothetical protein ABAC460_17110 [Asticcacaulis sp. AC460]
MTAAEFSYESMDELCARVAAFGLLTVTKSELPIAPDRQVRPPMRRSATRRKAVPAVGRNSVPERQTVWFEEQPGFGVREYATGREMFIVQYPAVTGNRTITIGNANVIDMQTALDVARRCIYHSDPDRNLADERKRTRKLPMFQDYLDDYWKVMWRQWKPSSQHTEDKYRRLYLADAFVDKGIDEIAHEDVAKWMVQCTRRGAPGAVNRAFERLKAVMRKAEDWGLRPEGSNPCRLIKANPRRKMERFLNEHEFARLGQAISASRERRPAHCAALLLIMLTGCRKDEIVGLTWGEVRGSRIYLDDSKTGARIVHLCSQARDILAGIKRGKPTDPVFMGRYGKGIDLDTYWGRMKREAKLGVIRLHDLRHSYASQAARLSLPLPTIQRLLGHTRLDSTARYTHFDDGHLVDVAQQISDLIDGATN